MTALTRVPEVKICGVCSAADATLAGAAGAAYVGVILAPGRARSLAPGEAEAVLAATSARRVGVFVDAPPDQVLGEAERLRLDVVQLHGAEPPAVAALLAAELPVQVWKAVPVRSAADVRHAGAEYAGAAHALLLDGWSPGMHGGAGVAFDWDDIAPARFDLPAGLRVVVAGGLTPLNVAAAVRALRPDVVDVSSGVEAEVRRKSAERVHEFIGAVARAADVKG